jgi:hypothetical protein
LNNRARTNKLFRKFAGKNGFVSERSFANEISARRLHQLFVPGLAALPRIKPGLRVEQEYPLDARESLRGFVYT